MADLSSRRRTAAAGPPDATAAMEIAVGYLGTRPRTRWETERRLRRAGTPQPVIDEVVERLGELGYVDDAAFARWWGEQRDRHAPRGMRMIEAELRQHGVPRDIIEEYRIEHRAPERRPEDVAVPSTEAERAADTLARHLRGRPLPSDRKALQRVGMFLVRRGFDPDTVRSAIREAGDESTEDVP